MSRKGQMPDSLFVCPIGHYKEKKRHKRVVMVVREWDQRGRPKNIDMVYEDQSVDEFEDICLRGGEFISGYIMERMLDPREANAGKKVT